MIEILDAGETLEVRATGRVTEQDYEQVLVPAIEKAVAGGAPVRMLYQIGPKFESYSPGALWADARLIRHWNDFDRVAVVTDSDMIETAIKMFRFAMPCPVKTFDLDEAEAARAWLRQTLGSIHIEDIAADALMVRLQGKLDAGAYAEKRPQVDAWVKEHGRFRLLLDLRQFDGWQGLGAIGEHLSLVREHRKAPKRVAVVGDEAWMKVAEMVMSNFLDAKTKFFDEDDFEAGRAWLLA